jgi:hypothetical protein
MGCLASREVQPFVVRQQMYSPPSHTVVIRFVRNGIVEDIRRVEYDANTSVGFVCAKLAVSAGGCAEPCRAR